MATSDLLDSLRDLDLPPPPPADSSALLLLAIGIAGLAMTALVLVIYRRHKRWIVEATQLLEMAKREAPAEHLFGMASALKRITLFRHSHPNIQGDDWLRWLDNEFKTDYFTHGDGRIFGDDLYQRGAEQSVSLDRINSELKRLLRQRWFKPW